MSNYAVLTHEELVALLEATEQSHRHLFALLWTLLRRLDGHEAPFRARDVLRLPKDAEIDQIQSPDHQTLVFRAVSPSEDLRRRAGTPFCGVDNQLGRRETTATVYTLRVPDRLAAMLVPDPTWLEGKTIGELLRQLAAMCGTEEAQDAVERFCNADGPDQDLRERPEHGGLHGRARADDGAG